MRLQCERSALDKRVFTLIVATIFGLAGCKPTTNTKGDDTAKVGAQQHEGGDESPTVKDIEVEIVTAAMKKIVLVDSTPMNHDWASVILIAESNATRILDIPEYSGDVPDELRKSFRSANEQERLWPPTINVRGIQVAQPGEFGRHVSEIDPQLFRSRYKYAQQAASVSRPGISKDGNRAVVFVESGVGRLSGGGCVVIMKKEAGDWMLHETVSSWVN